MEPKRNLQLFRGGSQPIYVTNPEMYREYKILQKSGIYHISNQPDLPLRLTLHPIYQYGRCGNPLMLTIFTLGIVPGYLPGAYVFEYDLETDGVVERRAHHLPLYERFSIWEWVVKRDKDKQFAEALAFSFLERRAPASP